MLPIPRWKICGCYYSSPASTNILSIFNNVAHNCIHTNAAMTRSTETRCSVHLVATVDPVNDPTFPLTHGVASTNTEFTTWCSNQHEQMSLQGYVAACAGRRHYYFCLLTSHVLCPMPYFSSRLIFLSETHDEFTPVLAYADLIVCCLGPISFPR